MGIDDSPAQGPTSSTSTSSILTTKYNNTEQKEITIFEDRIELILTKYQDILAKQSVWATPLGIVISIGIVFPTATFHDTLGIKAEYILFFFILALMASIIWLLSTISTSIKNHRKVKGSVIKTIILEMRGK